MKKLHLVCGSHIDPVWLWAWQEGVAAALSTFRVAVDFCENYDGYIFCHNEALLYQWVEEHEPALFAKIQELVKQKKWHIMGGWYIQPDCVHLTGESFIRQIQVGQRYFQDKFGVRPTTAINFDPFGHTRGLVQILKKTGYHSYLFMRPDDRTPGDFIWQGFDGSEIIGHKMFGTYGNLLGEATDKVKEFLESNQEKEIGMLVWGVGNHGGGASRVDLNNIAELQKNSNVEIMHSTPEAYFSEISKEGLSIETNSLTHVMVGCYTSMIRIKQQHRRLEALLGRAEKMLAHSGVDFDSDLLAQAEKALLFNEFHDILPGTMIRQGEEDALALFGFGTEIAERAATKSFYVLCSGQKKAEEGEIPIMVYNPQPYFVETEITAEYQLANQNWNEDENTVVEVYDEEGNLLASQSTKEACTINLDWRKRIIFRAKLAPMSMNRFNAKLMVVKNCQRAEAFGHVFAPYEENGTDILFENKRMRFAISKETGLITEYMVDGHSLLQKGAAMIGVFQDNEDPWGMLDDGYRQSVGCFQAVTDEEARAFNGYPQESHANVHVIENGDVCLKIQALFAYGNSHVLVTYTVYKQDVYVDLDYEFFTADVCKMFKLQLPTPFKDSRFLGQTAFGTEENLQGHREIVFQKWCGLEEKGQGLCVLTRGTAGGDADAGELRLSLLHTPVYAGHPINERPIVPHERHNEHIDMGQRHVSLRLMPYCDTMDAFAESFNEPLYTLSFFPSGAGEKPKPILSLSDKHVILSALRREQSGYVIRLYNASEEKREITMSLFETEHQVCFGAFEVKSFLYQQGIITETDMLGNPLSN